MILAIDPGTTHSGAVRPKKKVGCGKKGQSVAPAGSAEERTARRAESLKKAQGKYRKAHREKLNRAQREARKADPAKAAARMRDYRNRRPEVIAANEAKRVRPAGYRDAFNWYRREWAKLNPDKVREHAKKRSGAKLGRLPAGAVKSIGDRQRWKCAACLVSLKASGYHMDHVVPLARGGDHHVLNIQLLCPTCNLRKGSADPVEFMQRNGRLL